MAVKMLGKKIYKKKVGGYTLLSARPFAGQIPKEVLKVQGQRTPRARAIDRALTAPVLSYESPGKWLKKPNRYDLPNLDTPKGQKLAVIAMEPQGKVSVKKEPYVGEEIKPREKATIAPSEALPQAPAPPKVIKHAVKKSKDYWITKPGPSGVKQEKIKGTPVFIEEGFEAFLHKNPDSIYLKYAVSEATTGMQLSTGKTKAEAISNTIEKAKKWEKANNRPITALVQKTLALNPEYLTPPYQKSMESDSPSAMSSTIEQMATGAQKKPKLEIPKPQDVTKHIEDMEKGKKDWDADLELVSGKKGTNEGGLYKDKKTQTLHYLKWGNEDVAKIEALAGRLYQLAGTPVPSIGQITYGGKKCLSSDWIDNAKPMSIKEMSGHPDVRNNFVVDAWLANWDVIGSNADNIVKGPDGVAYRIDLGGSIIFRAQGKTKPFGADVPELESMTSTSTAPQAGQVFSSLTWQDKKAGATKVAKVTDVQIDEAVDAAGIPSKALAGVPDAESNLNKYLKKTLKARRNHIIENVLNYEPPKPFTVEELAKLADLKKKNIELIKYNAPNLIPKGAGEIKEKVHNGIIKDQMGNVPGQKAIDSLHYSYNPWKGSPHGTTSDLLRWAIAKRQGHEDSSRKILSAFWHHESKGDDKKYAELKAKFDTAVEKHGNDIMGGVAINNEMHKVLIREQMISKVQGLKSTKNHDKVTVYRSWRPDQAQYFGWGAAKVGDIIKVTDPLVFCFTFDKSIADHFYAKGGKTIKAEIPIDSVTLSDRLSNWWGSYSQEDEVLFVAPKGYTMEVVKA